MFIHNYKNLPLAVNMLVSSILPQTLSILFKSLIPSRSSCQELWRSNLFNVSYTVPCQSIILLVVTPLLFVIFVCAVFRAPWFFNSVKTFPPKIITVLLCLLQRSLSHFLYDANNLHSLHSIIFQVVKSNQLLDLDAIQLSGERFCFPWCKILHVDNWWKTPLLCFLFGVSHMIPKSSILIEYRVV